MCVVESEQENIMVFIKSHMKKKTSKIHPMHYQCAINFIFDNFVKCLGMKHLPKYIQDIDMPRYWTCANK